MGFSLVLSVSAGPGYYRHIQIDIGDTLYSLHRAIIRSFDFDDDHMHAFFMSNRAWDRESAFVCPQDDLDYALGHTDEVALSDFRFGKGSKFLYIFDFGDEWRFQIKVLRAVPESTDWPIVLKSVGEIKQYGYDGYDEDDEDEDDNDE